MPQTPGAIPPQTNPKPAAPKKAPISKSAGLVPIIVSVLVALIAVLGSYGWGYLLNLELTERESQLQQRQRELTKVKAEIKKEGTKKEAELTALSKNIREIQSKTFYWSRVLGELNTILPRNVIINSYTGGYVEKLQGDKKPNLFTIKGVTNSYTSVADTIDVIEASDFFKNVDFKGSSKKYSTGVKPTEAQLQLTFELEKPLREEDPSLARRGIPQVLSFSEVLPDNAMAPELEIEISEAPIDFEITPKAIAPLKGEFELSWEAPDGDIVEYEVYIATKPGQTLSPKKEVHIVPVVSRAFTNKFTYETEYPTRDYYFRVVAKDRSGKLSEPTEEIGMKAGDLEAPSEPLLEEDTIERRISASDKFKETIKLAWEPSDSEDIYRYHIYEGSDPDDLRLIHSTKDASKTAFSYNREVVFSELYFKVVAEDTSGNLSVTSKPVTKK